MLSALAIASAPSADAQIRPAPEVCATFDFDLQDDWVNGSTAKICYQHNKYVDELFHCASEVYGNSLTTHLDAGDPTFVLGCYYYPTIYPRSSLVARVIAVPQPCADGYTAMSDFIQDNANTICHGGLVADPVRDPVGLENYCEDVYVSGKRVYQVRGEYPHRVVTGCYYYPDWMLTTDSIGGGHYVEPFEPPTQLTLADGFLWP